MKMISISFCVFFSLSNLLFGQATSFFSNTPSILSKECLKNEFDSARRVSHHLGWGVGIVSGDINLGYDFGDIVLSTQYSHSITPISEIEIGLHFIPVQRVRNIDGIVIFKDSSRFMSLTWQTDIMWSLRPFEEGIFKAFCLGIGPSLRGLTAMGTNNTNPQILGPNMTTISSPLLRRVAFVETVSLGMHISVQYVVAQADNLEILLRARLHGHLPPIASNGGDWIFTSENGNLGSLTAILRFGW